MRQAHAWHTMGHDDSEMVVRLGTSELSTAQLKTQPGFPVAPKLKEIVLGVGMKRFCFLICLFLAVATTEPRRYIRSSLAWALQLAGRSPRRCSQRGTTCMRQAWPRSRSHSAQSSCSAVLPPCSRRPR